MATTVTPQQETPTPAATGTVTPQARLFAKMAKVLGAVNNVQKKGRNDHFKYDYVRESDLMDEIRTHLAENNVAFFASVLGSEKAGNITTVTIEVTFACGDSGATFTVQGIGCGQDAGEKGIYKSYTGAMKYVLWKTFLISTNDDPEKEEAPPRPQQRQAAQRPQAARPAVQQRPGDPPAPPADPFEGLAADDHGAFVMPIGKNKGRPIRDYSEQDLRSAAQWVRENKPGQYADLLAAIDGHLSGGPRLAA